MTPPPVILVNVCDAGIGADETQRLEDAGYIVLLTLTGDTRLLQPGAAEQFEPRDPHAIRTMELL